MADAPWGASIEMQPTCKPPPKWDGPPEESLLRAAHYYRTGFGFTMIEARDPDYVEAVREDIER